MDDPVPIVRGGSGLTGRPQIPRPEPDLEEPIGVTEDGVRVYREREQGAGMPANCLRVRSSPRGVCPGADCAGMQRDGGCLLDLVRAAQAAGVKWKFEVDPHDRFWDYAGDPIPGFFTRRGDYGQVHTSWEPGHEPGRLAEPKPPEPTRFHCPHCGYLNTQDSGNFHWWCSNCGRNAKEV